MHGQMDSPPFRRPGLFLVTQQLVVGSAEVVSGHAVADGPASGPVHVILDDELLRISTFLATARHVALRAHRSNVITQQCRLYLHWGTEHPPPVERGPSLESTYRVSLTVDLCEG